MATQRFGSRGRQEHHSMRDEDFYFRKDETRASYIVFAEGITKTRQSVLDQKSRLYQKYLKDNLKVAL